MAVRITSDSEYTTGQLVAGEEVEIYFDFDTPTPNEPGVSFIDSSRYFPDVGIPYVPRSLYTLTQLSDKRWVLTYRTTSQNARLSLRVGRTVKEFTSAPAPTWCQNQCGEDSHPQR